MDLFYWGARFLLALGLGTRGTSQDCELVILRSLFPQVKLGWRSFGNGSEAAVPVSFFFSLFPRQFLFSISGW